MSQPCTRLIRYVAILSVLPAAIATFVTSSRLLAQEGKKAELGKITIKAQFAPASKSQPARLFVTADIEKGWHAFSVTQKKGGPLATKIKLTTSKEYRLLADQFTASPAPEIHEDQEIWPDLPLEEHTGRVTWHIPIELAPGVDPKTLKIEGKVSAQRCKAGSCLPPKDFSFVAVVGPGVEVDDIQ